MGNGLRVLAPKWEVLICSDTWEEKKRERAYNDLFYFM